MEQLGLKDMALVSPIWVPASTWTANLSFQYQCIDHDIRKSTFGLGDPNFNDHVDPSI